MRRALLLFLAATLISLEARAADSGGQFAVKGIGGRTCEGFVTAKSESSDAYWMFLGWLDGYMTGINQYAPETYDITPWQSRNLLAALFEKFCARNPGANFFAVANKMTVELRDDRLRESSAPVVAKVGERTVGIYREILRRVQVLLKEGGHYKGEVDGLFGPNTRHALESYQKQVGLTVTGLPDQATLFKLLSPSVARN
jgi:hypothetical protein